MLRVAALVLLVAGCAPSGAPPADPACAVGSGRPAGLVLAGSGSNLALVRAIAEKYRAANPGVSVLVPESIGTSGAVRALADGAIDVGLASRALAEKERPRVARVVPLARSRVALAVHAPGGAAPSRAQVVDAFAGRLQKWPGGTPVVPLMRESGDSTYPVLAAGWPELHAAMRDALDRERFTVCYSDQEMRDALAETAGAVGLIDLGIARLDHMHVQVTPLDGLEKSLTFLLPEKPTPEAERFVAFACSPAVADLIAAGGYLPPERR